MSICFVCDLLVNTSRRMLTTVDEGLERATHAKQAERAGVRMEAGTAKTRRSQGWVYDSPSRQGTPLLEVSV